MTEQFWPQAIVNDTMGLLEQTDSQYINLGVVALAREGFVGFSTLDWQKNRRTVELLRNEEEVYAFVLAQANEWAKRFLDAARARRSQLALKLEEEKGK